MDAVRHKRRDFFQNIAIVLLTLSAVALFTQTQLYNLRDGNGRYLEDLLSSSKSILPGGSATPELRGFSAPVRVAVTGTYGRYGNISLTTADEAFSPLRTLLGEVLGSARAFVSCSESTFRAALSENSVYYDFLDPLPLSFLAGLAGETAANAELSARRLVVFSQEGGVFLCLWDGQSYLRSDTAVTTADLESAVNNYELTSASFAFDNVALDSGFASVAPYSLFPAELPALPVLTSAYSLPDTASLLAALGLNPYTNNRYLESSGTEVIKEGDRSLRIYPDGTVMYQGGSDSTLKIKVSGETLAPNEAAAWGVSFINGLLSSSGGDAAPYLQCIQQTGNTTLLQFGYHLDGVPIRFSDGSCGAEIVFSGNAVSTLQIRFRQYVRSGETSLLLPLRQALAIASSHSGAELSIGYADRGGSTISAAWLADTDTSAAGKP